MELILATKNKHKVEELKALLKGMPFEIFSLHDFPEMPEVIEDGSTFLENARKKARAISNLTGKLTLADDSGLSVDALNGEPGVHSARYSGRPHDYPANNRKLLEEMKDVPDNKRQASFICSMVLISPSGEEWNVEGRCNGTIIREQRGDKGFGYDPLFYISKYSRTMAELTMSEKNEISHRGMALRKIKGILLSQNFRGVAQLA